MEPTLDEAAGSGRLQPLRTAAFARFAAGDHAGALPYALAAAELFPGKGEVPFWLACIHSRLGEPEAAVAALRTGLARGLYWPQDWLLDDDDLALLHGRADFAAVVQEAEHAAARASLTAPPQPVVLPASSPRDGRRRPRALVLALHGWGQDADEFAAHWTAAAAAGFAVVVARSSQEPCPGFFVWDDRRRALGDVTAQLTAAVPDTGLRAAGTAALPAPFVTAGFSQGGGVAVDLALDGLPAPAQAVLALAAGLDDLARPPEAGRLAAAAARGLRVRLLAGDRDDALEDVRRLERVLGRAGIGDGLAELPGLAHAMPEPPGEQLAQELSRLLG